MSKESISPNHFFYPCCKEIGCNGILKLNFNEYLFIDYECDKNCHHKNRKFCKTFERFYLEQKTSEKCSKCNYNLDNNSSGKYICRECNKLYCISCFCNDNHINNNNNIYIKGENCKIHQMNYFIIVLIVKKEYAFIV